MSLSDIERFFPGTWSSTAATSAKAAEVLGISHEDMYNRLTNSRSHGSVAKTKAGGIHPPASPLSAHPTATPLAP